MVQIIDTSVAIKWFVVERGKEEALVVLEKLLESPKHFAVPELFYFELSHVFNRLIPSPRAEQLELFQEVLRLSLHRCVMTAELVEKIRHFQKLGLSGYDAAYVGLAKILKGTWLTFYGKAHRKIASLKLSRLLGE